MKIPKTVVGAMICSCMLNALGVDAYGYHVWLSDGEGTWNDRARWEGGDVPTTAGSKVRITAAAMVVDGDFSVIDNCSELLLDVPSAAVVFENANSARVAAKIIGSGSIVKNGDGDLHLDCVDVDGLHTARGIVVNRGNLYLPSSTSDRRFGLITVNSPGVLYVVPTGNTIVDGLYGDGTVLNPGTSNRELKFGKNDANTHVGVFSGIIGPNIDITMIGGRQDMLTVADTTSRNLRLYSGALGVEHPNSLGTGVYWLRGDNNGDSITVRYLGNSGGDTGVDIRMQSDCKQAILDAGAHGGLNFTREMRFSNSSGKMSRLVLDGSNTEACVISGGFMEGDEISTYVTKRGSGTWRFAGSPSLRHCRGVFAVEQGTIEFDSIAEAGVRCSLGYQNILHDDYAGPRDDSRKVPYAFLLGNGSVAVDGNTGTLNYIGSTAGMCTSRPIALKGAGRISNTGGSSLSWTGVTSAREGTNVLVLAGSGTENLLCDVTNGVGQINLVKEGPGTWCIDANIDITGEVVVQGGRLELRNNRNYRWFRLNIKETWAESKGSTDNQLFLSGFTLLDKDGNMLTEGFTHDPASDGNTKALAAGTAAMARTGYTILAGRVLNNLFVNDASIFNVTYGYQPRLTDQSTWISVVVRLPDNAAPAIAYDMCATVGGNPPHDRNAMSWSIEGSIDGSSWVELDNVVSNSTVQIRGVAKYANYSWYTSGTTESIGFPIEGMSREFVKMSRVSSVQVSRGGTLWSDSSIVADALHVDCSVPAGSIGGVKFQEGATLELTNISALPEDGMLPVEFTTDLSGVQHLADVSPIVDGTRAKRYSIVFRNEKLFLVKPGIVLYLR